MTVLVYSFHLKMRYLPAKDAHGIRIVRLFVSSWIKRSFFLFSGRSSSARIASTGHSGTHKLQSMHSSGSITSILGPSWKQSTGHTSTQSVYLHLMHLSRTTKVTIKSFQSRLHKGDTLINCDYSVSLSFFEAGLNVEAVTP